ncbi:MAG: efflux RND transporter periplasmic adaptor subunit [Beijerinckiaceae bacterium]
MNDNPIKISKQEVDAVLGAGRVRHRWLWRMLLALLTIGGAALGYWRWNAAPASSSGRVTYVTRPAEISTITLRVTGAGSVQPTNKVDVSSELSGIIREVRVDYNSTVKAGDVLAVLDQVKLTAAVENSRARLGIAQASYKDALVQLEERTSNWDRKRRLAETSATSATDRDAAKASYESAVVAVETAKSNIQAAQAQLKLDETNLSRSQIVSPINGVVLMRKVDPGQTVASSLQAPVLFTIAEDLTRMEVQVDIDEAAVGGVREGQAATFSVDAYPNRRFDARIRMVRYGSEIVQGVVTYKAILTTNNNDLLLRPGMTATADIVVADIPDVLTVPNQAFRFTPPSEEQNAPSRGFLESILPGRPSFRPPSASRSMQGPNRVVHVLRDGVPAPVQVVSGASDERRTQIVKGALKPGDQVIVDTVRRR